MSEHDFKRQRVHSPDHSPPSATSLFDLPAEVRLLIYGHLFDDLPSRHIWCYMPQIAIPKRAPITLASRKLRAETLPLYLSRTTFCFHLKADGRKGSLVQKWIAVLDRLSRSIDPSVGVYRHLRRIIICVDLLHTSVELTFDFGQRPVTAALRASSWWVSGFRASSSIISLLDEESWWSQEWWEAPENGPARRKQTESTTVHESGNDRDKIRWQSPDELEHSEGTEEDCKEEGDLDGKVSQNDKAELASRQAVNAVVEFATRNWTPMELRLLRRKPALRAFWEVFSIRAKITGDEAECVECGGLVVPE